MKNTSVSKPFDNTYPMYRVIALAEGGFVYAHVNCSRGDYHGFTLANKLAAAAELEASLQKTLSVFKDCIGVEAFADFQKTNPAIRDAEALLKRLR